MSVAYGMAKDTVRSTAEAYIAAFGGAPWYELFTVGGRRIGTQTELAELVGSLMRRTVNPEDVKPFYTIDGVSADIEKAINSPGTVLAVASDRSSGGTVGALWILQVDAIGDARRRDTVGGIISMFGLPLDKVGYLAEAFVRPEYQGLGVGVSLATESSMAAAESGYRFIIFSTINEYVVRIYQKLCGPENVYEAYRDAADPQGRKYYLVTIKAPPERLLRG